MTQLPESKPCTTCRYFRPATQQDPLPECYLLRIQLQPDALATGCKAHRTEAEHHAMIARSMRAGGWRND